MASVEDTSLKEYLRLSARKTKDPVIIGEYDDFLLQLWTFFELRSAAEEYYDKHRYVAKSRQGALPLHWRDIKNVLEHGGPPEQLITRIAKKDFACVDALIKNMRKVLSRIREKVSIGRVQQMDAHCLKWFIRQPGRNAIEKAGAKQQILGVVRIENYDTLENRILKDFLLRCASLASLYLRANKKWEGHATYTSVRRFKNLCEAGLSLEVMDSIRSIYELPQPNYVLQQDRLYSKIWTSYCQLLRQEEVAENLWQRHEEVGDLYAKCIGGIKLHCSPRAKYDTPLWFNDMDGKKDLIDNPCWHNELTDKDIVEPEYPSEDIVVVDFTNPWDKRDTLVYPKVHKNARPYIKNWRRPSYEREDSAIELSQMLINQDAVALNDFLRNYYGLVQGKRWVVLTPDHWEAQWIEKVAKAHPDALSRRDVFMMWRSVAAALGMATTHRFTNRDEILVSDGFQVPWRNNILIRFVEDKETGRILPQRASKRLHGDNTKANCRFWLKRGIDDASKVYDALSQKIYVQCIGATPEEMFSRHDDVPVDQLGQLLKVGALRYVECKKRKEIAYYDELAPLYMVTQNRNEEVEFKTLIKHMECWPGGEVYRTEERKNGGRLPTGARKVSLNLLEGMKSDTAPLKLLEQDLDAPLENSSDIFFEAEVTPGQGLATITFSADFIDEPQQLDLEKMQAIEGLTKVKIEREMKRHFPPVMPYVEASEDIWFVVKGDVQAYMQDIIKIEKNRNNDLFYKAQPYYGIIEQQKKKGARHYGRSRLFDEQAMSPIDKLKRENVFGNAPGHECPHVQFNWKALFKKLASDYRSGNDDVLRLIAWTYQWNNSEYEFIRKQLCSLYIRGGTLRSEQYTFCANCFAERDKRVADILKTALKRIVAGDSIVAENDFRLAYNLMQFYPKVMECIDSDLCDDAFMAIYKRYNRYPFLNSRGEYVSTQAVKMAGYFIKCMMFLLHRRRYDPSFMRRSENWQPYGFLAQSLPTRSPTQESHEAMRKSFLNYVRGCGTIEGIPLGD